MPYIAMRNVDELRFRDIRMVNATRRAGELGPPDVRAQIQAILAMHKDVGLEPARARPLQNIGVIMAMPDFSPPTPVVQRRVDEFRSGLFLSCLSGNVELTGPNAGIRVYTAENFDIVSQNFTLGSKGVAESAGVIVNITVAGYRLDKTTFPRPSYVNLPQPFRHEEDVLLGLGWLRRVNRKVYRQVMGATAVFLESYRNSPAVDVRARVLLQASAFEILLDLPERQQRKAFKIEIERLTSETDERKYHYTFESYGRRVPDTRTLKGIWADRFYTLRNHIIHGAAVRRSEYIFRGTQHHLVIAPMFFVCCIKRLIDQERSQRNENQLFFAELHSGARSPHQKPRSEDLSEGRAFAVVTNHVARWLAKDSE